MSRRTVISVLMAGVLSAGAIAHADTEVPAQPLQWGAEVNPTRTNMQNLETSVGRTFASSRIFVKWNTTFPASYESWLLSTGHELMVSVKSVRVNGSRIPFVTVANAQPGSTVHNEMIGWVNRLGALGVPVWFTYNHEPMASASSSLGTATEYIAAWRKWIDLFRSRGVTNVKFMWIATDQAFWLGSGDRRQAIKWYPGDAYVDGIAGDAYNWYNCRTGIANPWKSLQTIIDPMRRFGLQHPDEALYLTEWASAEDPAQPGRKAQWITDARALFKQPGWEQFDGVDYFNLMGQGNCDWRVGSSASSLAAFGAMGQDPFYGGGAQLVAPIVEVAVEPATV